MIYRQDGIVFMQLQDPVWGSVKIARILPTNTSWGVFFSISEREESQLIPQISDSIIDRASRGDSTPFMNSGVREPKGCLKKIATPKECAERESCISHDPTKCLLGNRKMPDCFNPTTDENLRPLVLAWLEGYYVVREEN